jgi:hypothetical protein
MLPFSIALFAAVPAFAADQPFSATLTAENRSASGLAHLNPTQISALDAFVQREVKLARDGDVIAFAGGFSQRRSAAERTAAGIDQLTPKERETLDSLVAREIAVRPQSSSGLLPPTSSSVHVQTTTVKPEIHGSVTLGYGWGSGGSSLYGGEMNLNYTDPSGKTTTSFTYAELHGKGFNGVCNRPGRGW